MNCVRDLSLDFLTTLFVSSHLQASVSSLNRNVESAHTWNRCWRLILFPALSHLRLFHQFKSPLISLILGAFWALSGSFCSLGQLLTSILSRADHSAALELIVVKLSISLRSMYFSFGKVLNKLMFTIICFILLQSLTLISSTF